MEINESNINDFVYDELNRYFRIRSKRVDKGFFTGMLMASKKVLLGEPLSVCNFVAMLHHSRDGEHLNAKQLRSSVKDFVAEINKRYSDFPIIDTP